MNWSTKLWTLPALLAGVLFISGCGNTNEPVAAQPLALATPAPLAAGGATLPPQIVVVIVTPTASADSGGQQQSGQQQSGQQQSGQGQQQASGGEGQAVAQAQGTPQGTPQSPEGGSGQPQQEGSQQQGGGQVNEQELISAGEQVYTGNCASCHQPNGEGTSAFPSLAGSGLLTSGDPTSAIQIVVNGQGQMPAFGDSLSADDIAAVLSYERN